MPPANFSPLMRCCAIEWEPDFHKCVFATGIGHPAQQAVEGDRIRGGMFGRYGPVVDAVAYGGNQSDFISEMAECII